MIASTQQIPYKDFIIEPEKDPWALAIGWYYRYYREGSNGERIYNASTIEEAKQDIDERQENTLTPNTI